jgi:hypothetical protein
MYLEYFETTAEDFMEHFECGEELKRAMCKPVAPNGKCHFDSKQTERVINFAWFENPRRPAKISIWDEAARQKMRQPVLINDHHRFDDHTIRNLIRFASF